MLRRVQLIDELKRKIPSEKIKALTQIRDGTLSETNMDALRELAES